MQSRKKRRRNKIRTKKKETTNTMDPDYIDIDGRPFKESQIEVEGTRMEVVENGVKELKITNASEEETISIDPILHHPPTESYVSDSEDDENDENDGPGCSKGIKEDTDSEESDASSTECLYENRNTRALDAEEPTYKLETFEKNAMIIFNQIDVKGYKPRIGTLTDGKRMKFTLKRFGFVGKEHKNLTKDEIFAKLQDFSEIDFTDYGCIAVVVMTHGGEGGLLMAKDVSYNELDILNYFKHREKPKLVTKPVVLIIQACRGYSDLRAAQAGKKMTFTDKDNLTTNEVKHYHIPVEADTLVLHSSYFCKASHRERNGTWFIQALCNNIDQFGGTRDLEDIMTEVRREVAIKKYHRVKNRKTGKYDINKQMPVVTSSLIRKLYLKKYGDEPPVLRANLSMSSSFTATDQLVEGRDSVDHMIMHYNAKRRSDAEILRQCQYMRKVLLQYANTTEDKTAEYLLQQSNFDEDNFVAEVAQTTLIAMSGFLKDKYNKTTYKNLIYYYEVP